MGNYFCGHCCALMTLCKIFFTLLVTLIYKTMCLRRPFSLVFLCALFISITVKGTLIQTRIVQQPSARHKLRDILLRIKLFRKFRCFVLLHHQSHIIRNTGKNSLNLLICSKYYFNKIFCCF